VVVSTFATLIRTLERRRNLSMDEELARIVIWSVDPEL
jgi:hypothetical protein